MKNRVYNHTLAYLLLFISVAAFGQKKYTSKATSSKLTLEGKSLVGYKTTFDFEWSDVRRGWWKYAREFGAPINMKTYYKVNIPSETNDGNVNLVIFTQAQEVKGGTAFFLGLENNRYKEQASILIKDFKKKFYINDLLDHIADYQRQSDELSDDYRNAVGQTRKQELLKKITSLESKVESLKEQIRIIEKS